MQVSTPMLLACLLAVPCLAALPDGEAPATSRIVAAGLFKNGLAVITREVNVPGPGTYRIDDIPDPVHGTYWIDSNAPVESRAQWRLLEVTHAPPGHQPLQAELVGRNVTVHLKGAGTPPISGEVLDPGGATRDASSESSVPAFPAATRFLVLATPKGQTYVDQADIAYVESEGRSAKLKQRQTVLVITVEQPKKEAPRVTITYLARGLSWAPSYRVDITDPKVLAIEQSAVIKNEMADLMDAETSLISGFPSTQFAHVTSPLSLRTTLNDFFRDLSRKPERNADVMGNSMTQVPMARSAIGLHPALVPTGDGVDVHYRSIGKRTLARGEALALSLARATSPYERIVEWLVSDTRDAVGRPHEGRDNDRGVFADEPWDALRFANPFDVPMTTGPAMVVAHRRFNGQQTSAWVNPGEETILHITRALSIRTRCLENEERQPDRNEGIYVGGRLFRKTTVHGELAVSNHRKGSAALVIRRRISGDLLSADGNPKTSVLEEGVYSINRRIELLWKLRLKSGEERKLAYRYLVLVQH